MTFVQPRLPKVSYRTRLMFVLYFVAEVAAFVGVALALNTLAAILITIATTFLGTVLLRILGTKALKEYRNALLANEPPTRAVASGAIGVIGSILLILPGFVTDLTGVLLVLPPTRRLLRPAFSKLLAKRTEAVLRVNWFGKDPRPRADGTDEDVIDGEVVDGEAGDDGQGPHDNGPRSLP